MACTGSTRRGPRDGSRWVRQSPERAGCDGAAASAGNYSSPVDRRSESSPPEDLTRACGITGSGIAAGCSGRVRCIVGHKVLVEGRSQRAVERELGIGAGHGHTELLTCNLEDIERAISEIVRHDA